MPESAVEQPDPAAIETNKADAAIDRLNISLREGATLNDGALRAMALQAHSDIMAEAGSQERALQSLDALKAQGAVSEGMATVYREALEASGGDSRAFAAHIVENKDRISQAVTQDLATSPTMAVSLFNNFDKGMSAEGVQGISQVAYESLLKVSDNNMETLTATIDSAVEAGQLNADNAAVIKQAAQTAGTDSARFAQLMAENKDSLSEIVVLQAGQRTPGSPDGPAAAAGGGTNALSNMFGGADNPFMQFLNALIMAFTGGKSDFNSLFDNIKNGNNGTAGPGQEGQRDVAAAEPATRTPAEPAKPEPVAAAGDGAETRTAGADTEVETVAHEAGAESREAEARAPIMATAVVDTTGITAETAPVVDHESGGVSIGGLPVVDRFGMNANPDPMLIASLDPFMDPALQTGAGVTNASYESTGQPYKWDLGLMA